MGMWDSMLFGLAMPSIFSMVGGLFGGGGSNGWNLGNMCGGGPGTSSELDDHLDSNPIVNQYTYVLTDGTTAPMTDQDGNLIPPPEGSMVQNDDANVVELARQLQSDDKMYLDRYDEFKDFVSPDGVVHDSILPAYFDPDSGMTKTVWRFDTATAVFNPNFDSGMWLDNGDMFWGDGLYNNIGPGGAPVDSGFWAGKAEWRRTDDYWAGTREDFIRDTQQWYSHFNSYFDSQDVQEARLRQDAGISSYISLAREQLGM
jgi:hypothetical protein